MIKQTVNFEDLLEKKYKILRTSIMLGNLKNRFETIQEYEDTVREIDKIRNREYEEQLSTKLYSTNSLEEEKNRLMDLISFIQKRINDKKSFIEDFVKVTSNNLNGLTSVSLEGDLPYLNTRYNDINSYLNNKDEIDRLEKELLLIKKDLEDKYDIKTNNETVNSTLEDQLLEEFNRLISSDEYYNSLNYTDIDLELSKISESLIDKKNILDTFNSSYQALVSAGISGAEKEEYSSYVQDARNNYYFDIEKQCILNLYKLVLDKQTEFAKIINKRNEINALIADRNNIRNNLEIRFLDDLSNFTDLCDEQYSIIKSQKENVDTIDNLIMNIAEMETRLDNLNIQNSSDSIMTILNEFSLNNSEKNTNEISENNIEEIVRENTPFEGNIEKNSKDYIENNDIFLDDILSNPQNDIFVDEPLKEEVNKNKPANMVIKIKNAEFIDTEDVANSSKLVMRKVVESIDPERYNKQTDSVKVNHEIISESSNNKDFTELNIDNIFEPIKDIPILNNNNIGSTFTNGNDIFLDDDEYELKNVNTNIGIDVSDDNIFLDSSSTVEENKQEQKTSSENVNFFETISNNDTNIYSDGTNESVFENMPIVDKIGTVKPNSALSQIADTINDNNNIILPDLGLVNSNTNIPLNGDDYLN